MSRTTRNLLVALAAMFALASLACGSGDGSEPAPEPTLTEKCERRCGPVPEPAADADEEDQNPCAGRVGPDDCVARCVAGVEAVESKGERCTDCVFGTTGWWGTRTIRKSTNGPIDIKTSCKEVHYRGGFTGSSSDVDFSSCTPSEMCDQFVFPEPALGTYCGPYCGFDGSTAPDMSSAADMSSLTD